jgi:hypothetical protein
MRRNTRYKERLTWNEEILRSRTPELGAESSADVSVGTTILHTNHGYIMQEKLEICGGRRKGPNMTDS